MSRSDEFFSRLQLYGPRSCIEVGEFTYTYACLQHEIQQWQHRFDGWDVPAGMVIGLRSDYSIWAVAALLALLSRRSVAALITRDRDAAHQLKEARAAALLDLTPEGDYEWSPLAHSSNHPLLDKLRSSGDGGLIIFTSGSTATPKAALQSFERFLYKFRKPGRSLRTLAFLLFDHIGGLDTLFYTLANGGTLILTRRRDPDSVLNLIDSHKVEVLPTSSSFLRLCVARGGSTSSISSLRVITYGSEPMDPMTLERLGALFPNVQISQKYGATEIGSPPTVSRADNSLWVKFKSDAVETRVVDDVLWIRTEGAMLGYLNAAAGIDADGWLCTGDLVDVDGEWIMFRGRRADIINVGGQKVAPVEVEQVILKLNFVQEAIVTGEPHSLLGQIVTAKVRLLPGVDVREAVKNIRVHCQVCLPRYKVPMRIVASQESMIDVRQKLRRNPASMD